MRIHPVVLCGGSGTRLWPLSSGGRPKQFLRLTSDRTLLQETVLRLGQPDLFADPVIVCNAGHRRIVAEQLAEIGVEPAALLLEPTARSTAAAVAAAARHLADRDPGAVMAVISSDHWIASVERFWNGVRTAGAAAAHGHLVTLGVAATAPETGYGYIAPGAALDGVPGAFRIARFVEKPDARAAMALLRQGDHFWNTGIFVFGASGYLDELRRLQPSIAAAAEGAVRDGVADGPALALDRAAFAASPGLSIDVAVMERTDRAAFVPVDFPWSDVGSWAAIWELGDKDGDGNVRVGDVLAHEVTGSYLRGDGPTVAVVGLSDVVVVATGSAVLVAARDRAQDIRHLSERLKAAPGADKAP